MDNSDISPLNLAGRPDGGGQSRVGIQEPQRGILSNGRGTPAATAPKDQGLAEAKAEAELPQLSQEQQTNRKRKGKGKESVYDRDRFRAPYTESPPESGPSEPSQARLSDHPSAADGATSPQPQRTGPEELRLSAIPEPHVLTSGPNGSSSYNHLIPGTLQKGWRALLQRFDFRWFAFSASTSSTSMLFLSLDAVYPQPFYYKAAVVFHVLGLIQIWLTAVLMILRLVLWPRLVLMTLKHHSQITFCATFPINLAIVFSLVACLMGNDHDHGAWATYLLASWWIVAILAVLVNLAVFYLLYVLSPLFPDLRH